MNRTELKPNTAVRLQCADEKHKTACDASRDEILKKNYAGTADTVDACADSEKYRALAKAHVPQSQKNNVCKELGSIRLDSERSKIVDAVKIDILK